jgi:hypothetical protein
MTPSDAYITFQKFNDIALAEAIAEQLHKNGINSVVSKEDALLDSTFIGSDLGSTIHLKVAPTNFERANAILEDFYMTRIQSMDPDYYLYTFTDEELLDIVQKPDEWGHLDFVLAKKLLADKGKAISPAQQEEFHQERLTQLAKPDKTHPLMILLGYFTAFAGGVFGFILGSLLVSSKKILPNGQRVYMYPISERRHGRRILIISAICFSLWMSLKFNRGI